jgi:hypothetical protein
MYLGIGTNRKKTSTHELLCFQSHVFRPVFHSQVIGHFDRLRSGLSLGLFLLPFVLLCLLLFYKREGEAA